jgi:hypothetical protein
LEFRTWQPDFSAKAGLETGLPEDRKQVTVEGYLAKDGSRMANARKVTLASGRSVFAGSSFEEPAKK